MQDKKPQIEILAGNVLVAMYRLIESSQVPRDQVIAKLKELVVKIQEMIKALEETDA